MAIGAIGTDIIEREQAEPAISMAMEEARRRYLPRHIQKTSRHRLRSVGMSVCVCMCPPKYICISFCMSFCDGFICYYMILNVFCNFTYVSSWLIFMINVEMTAERERGVIERTGEMTSHGRVINRHFTDLTN